MKILKILSFILVVFIFSSCQKCTECTNENLLGGGNGDGIDIEIEVCEDDVVYMEGYGYMSKEEYVDELEAQGYNCYTNIW